MKRTSKLLVLLAALGLLVACGNGGNNQQGGGGNPSGGDEDPQEETANLINVIYFNTYVSDSRANEIKNGLIEALEAQGEEVDATKINFFQSRNSKVAGLGEEILNYNEDNPTNTIDVLLGANSFSAWDDEELKPLFEAKYENDGLEYTYGTHSNLTNNTNRKFFYDKEKLNDKYVHALHEYLKEHYTGEQPEDPVEETNNLTVMVYGTFVSEERTAEIKSGFEAYLTAHELEIANLAWERDAESTSIADFMAKVAEYDAAHPDAKVDALLGLKTNAAITAAGFSNDGTEFTYSDSEGHESDRRFWYNAQSENLGNIKHLEAYLKANWVPAPIVENTYFLVGSINEWNTENPTLRLGLVEEGHYAAANIDLTEGDELKVFCPETAEYFTNASTWENCFFTLGDNSNIVVSETGKYTVDFYLNGENNNHVVLSKQETTKSVFVIAIYDKFIDADQATQIIDEAKEYFVAHDITADVVSTNLGTGNMNSAASAVETYNQTNAANPIDVILGLKITNDKFTQAGYELGTVNYTYGNASTDNDRKISVLSSSKERAEYLAFVDYMNANWLPVEEVTYYLIGSMTNWNEEELSYALTKVAEGEYKIENVALEEGDQFKVFKPGETAEYFTNASTWENCFFTLGDNNNIVVSETGVYSITFYINGQNNNHVVLAK